MFAKLLVTISLLGFLTACSWVNDHDHTANPTTTVANINCELLKKQLLYNNTNPNLEVSTMSSYQRKQLKQFYLENCL